MKTKEDIVNNWLPRYTGVALNEFGQYILLTNFSNYVYMFAEQFGVEVRGTDKPMQSATSGGITIINFGMGSPKAALFLGKCGGLKKTKLGDLVLPIAAIRGDGTSDDYLPKEIPALPSFRLQRAVSSMIKKHELDYYTGTVYTTNRRVWEHDQEFKDYLRRVRALAVDMETATIFVVGFMNDIPHGALLLVSDNPMTPEGVKTAESDSKVTTNFVKQHLMIGIESLLELKNSGESVKHLKFE
jgi:AMP nucleosidase